MARNYSEGSILVTVLIVMTVLSISLTSLLKLSTHHFLSTQNAVNREQALYLAESGIELASLYFLNNADLLPALTTQAGDIGDGTFLYAVTNSGFRQCDIYAEGEINGVKRAIQIEGLRNATYGEFAFFAQDNRGIYFKSGEKFFGRIHTDSTPYFTGNPVFKDEFSTKASDYGGSIDQVEFKGGFTLNEQNAGDIAEVDFSGMRDFADEHDEGLLLRGATEITFDGEDILITNQDKKWNNQRITLNPEQLIYVERKGQLQGTVSMNGGTLDGRVTIVAESDIMINNHLEYRVNPLDSNAVAQAEAEGIKADDALGLISGDDVIISQSAPRTGITIHATIMATGAKSHGMDHGSFFVEGLLPGHPNDYRGFINLVGGVVQETRGGVGYFDIESGTTESGYEKNYSFDTRFTSIPPPYYPPLETKLTYVSWKEVVPES